MVYYDKSDYLHAIPFFKYAAENGNVVAAEKLANCYKRTDSAELAIPYWEICRAAGIHSANTNYASYLKEETDQHELAMQLWRDAAKAGVPQAAFNLGVWLKNLGKIEEAKGYLKSAGDLGYMDGYFVLAGIFYHEEDWNEALEALSPLSEVGDERAETMVAAIREAIDLSQEDVFVDLGRGFSKMNFNEKASVISSLWIEFRNDEDFSDFMSYNDIGCPLAYVYTNGLATELSQAGISMITETFEMFLGLLEVTEDEIDEVLPDKNLGAILVFAHNKRNASSEVEDEDDDATVFHNIGGERTFKL
jgi:tetratricopeptide (TPR) repeat protein